MALGEFTVLQDANFQCYFHQFSYMLTKFFVYTGTYNRYDNDAIFNRIKSGQAFI